MGWQAVVHAEDRERVAGIWCETVETGRTYETEYRLRRFDGSYRWFVARGIPVRGQDGKVRQWLGSSTDIDDLKRTEAALRRSNEELGQFAYAAAHDLQEPLRNISNSLGLIQRMHVDRFDRAAGKWIDFSVEGAQRMHDMVKDLLTYARAVDGSERLGNPVNATAAVQTALANLTTTINAAEAKIEIGPLPRVWVLEAHLVQIFQNLIANSVKYRQKHVQPEIRISAHHAGGEWRFSVADNGIGFDPQYAGKIFGVFKRLHQRNEYQGNGIGLAICARIVTHYGGRIWAESQTGRGATFHFTLPAQEPSA
jgi:light-regulated signal transduction histidine kinase (bacteriophytochrome)